MTLPVLAEDLAGRTFRAANRVVVPLRLYSWVMVWPRPVFSGRPGRVRSSAWIRDVSSTDTTTDTTTAWAGGLT